MSDTTTIAIDLDVKKELIANKRYPRETYNDILKRLLGMKNNGQKQG